MQTIKDSLMEDQEEHLAVEVVTVMEMEEVMAVVLKDQLDHLVLVEDRAMGDEARVDQEDQEDQQEV